MDQQPIVALHGWQDNAGTFEHLIPLLPADIAILCVDLPSHGLSSHLHEGQYYCAYWEPLFALRRIQKYYKWNKVSQQVKVIQRSFHIFNLCIIHSLIHLPVFHWDICNTLSFVQSHFFSIFILFSD